MRHRHRHHHGHGHGHYQIIVPSSNPQSLVFPYDPINKKFHTLNYQPVLTQGRVTAEEIDEFLKEVNVPIKAFYEEHNANPCGLVCLILLCTIICPLFPFMMCYLISKSNKMMEEMKKAIDKAAIIVKSRGTTFTERGLLWNMPAHFPKWIELWTSVGGPGQPVMQPYYQGAQYGVVSQPGIEMQTVPQQNYQNTYGVSNQV